MIWDVDGEEEPAFEDGSDWSFVSGWRLGRVWERLRTEKFVKAVLPCRSTEMVFRIAEAKGLPCRSEYLSDTYMLVTFGTPADLTSGMA